MSTVRIKEQVGCHPYCTRFEFLVFSLLLPFRKIIEQHLFLRYLPFKSSANGVTSKIEHDISDLSFEKIKEHLDKYLNNSRRVTNTRLLFSVLEIQKVQF